MGDIPDTQEAESGRRNDAMQFVMVVRNRFQDNREKYEEFLRTMRDFESKRIDVDEAITIVTELFKEHTDLSAGFNSFVNNGWEIDEAEIIDFLNKFKNRLKGDDKLFNLFLDILNLFRREKEPVVDVYNEVMSLFDKYRDLLEEFLQILPSDVTVEELCERWVSMNNR